MKTLFQPIKKKYISQNYQSPPTLSGIFDITRCLEIKKKYKNWASLYTNEDTLYSFHWDFLITVKGSDSQFVRRMFDFKYYSLLPARTYSQFIVQDGKTLDQIKYLKYILSYQKKKSEDPPYLFWSESPFLHSFCK